MVKKKFIDRKHAATFRLVYKDYTPFFDQDGEDEDADGDDRVFTRVDGRSGFVPGFSEDDPVSCRSFAGDAENDQNSIFADADEDEDDENEEEEEEEGGNGQLKKDGKKSAGILRPDDRCSGGGDVGGLDKARMRGGVAPDRFGVVSSKGAVQKNEEERIRREIVELGFPDDGYNYLQHLRSLGGKRSAAFVPTNNTHTPSLRADVKVFDASKVPVAKTLEQEAECGDSLHVSSRTFEIRSRPSAPKTLDSDVLALLEASDESIFDSADELEDDFISKANESVIGEESGAPIIPHTKTGERRRENQQSHADGDIGYKDGRGLITTDDQEKRPSRFLDEQFELLALNEYEDDEIGELDEDDPTTRGSAHVSQFGTVLSDFLKDSSFFGDKYIAPGDLKHKNTREELREWEVVSPTPEKSSEKVGTCPLNENNVGMKIDTSEEEDEEEEIILVEDDSDSGKEKWDCETIVSTFSNLDNHPAKITTPSLRPAKERPSKLPVLPEVKAFAIKLGGKQNLPLDYLPGLKKPIRSAKRDEDHKPNDAKPVKLKAEETKEERKARKAAVKEDRREARKAKKELKMVYRGEAQRAQYGAASTGPSVIRLS